MTAATSQELLQQIAERAAQIFATGVEVGWESRCFRAGTGSTNSSDSEEWLQVPFSCLEHAGVLRIFRDASVALSPRLAEGVVELLVNQVALLDCLPQQHELKNQFINRLLQGHAGDGEDEVLREGQILGMNLSRPRAILLIDASEYLEPKRAAQAGLPGDGDDWLRTHALIRHIVRFFSLPNDAICGYLGRGEIAVLKASTSQDLDPWAGRDDAREALPPSWSNLDALKVASSQLIETLERETGARLYLGIGRYHPGIRGLSRSYQDAMAALRIGRKLTRDRRMYCLDQLGLPALVGITDEETRTDLARHLLGPLESEPELLRTLLVFFEHNCSIISASASLYIHRNTLNYRLEKISSLTGLDPRRFDEASMIRYAMTIRQLAGDFALCD